MTSAGAATDVLADPVGLVVRLVAAAEPSLDAEVAHDVVTAVAGGRAKRRRLAAALAARPALLTDGRSPAPRVAGALLIALRKAGAVNISPPACACCGKHLRTLQRHGEHWYCAVCAARPQQCISCGQKRIVVSRDRHGQPRCERCPDRDDRDPLAVLTQVITSMDPSLPAETIAAAARRVFSKTYHLQRLAWVIEEAPGLLTGGAADAPMAAVLRLIDQLCDAGAQKITRPACPRCHRVVHLHRRRAGRWICRNCLAKARAVPCARCGAVSEPAARDHHGGPLCAHCLITDPANQEACIKCGRRKQVAVRAPEGPICPACRAIPPATCSICGRLAPCEVSKATGQPWCRACQQRWLRCTGCGEVKQVRGGTTGEPLCATCARPGPGFWRCCPDCGTTGRLRAIRCTRCTLGQQLQQLLTGPAGVISPELQLLKDSLIATERPVSTLTWLNGPGTRPALASLAAGSRPLTHRALDGLGASKTITHLRSVLVASGALPARDEQLARLERWINEAINAILDPADRQVIRRYAIWHHLRRLRRRAAPAGTTYGQLTTIRRLTRAAIRFLELLAGSGLTLATCTQAHLDRWLAEDQVPHRADAGAFIRWATARKLTRLDFPATKWNGPQGPINAGRRWVIARRLLHDGTLPAADRFAGLLVVLYAQTATAISQLTTGHLTRAAGDVRLRLGQEPIILPEPLATLATHLAADRRGHAVTGNSGNSAWLLPGGQPGRPISAHRIRERLAALGIHTSDLRTAALFQLASELPAAILARMLGIHIDVAVQWQRAAAGDWTAYAADVSRRAQP